MLNTIQDAVKQLLPARKKTSSNGWISFNAPCCVHNGESADTRSRGGMVMNPDGGTSYHCFNCNFKANYTPGRHLNYKFRKLLSWFGASENEVKRLVIDALRVKDLIAPEQLEKVIKEEVAFKARPLPEDAVSFSEWKTFLTLQDEDAPVHPQFVTAFNYIYERKIDWEKYEFYTTENQAYNLHKRVIIPFKWKGQTIGYTARTWDDGVKPKYHNHHEPNYVFNVDEQVPNRKFVLVMEGPFDAMSVDGVAILGSECSEAQADIIDSLGREVIVVPDFDLKEVKGKMVWAGEALVDKAIEYGWSVSFPVWQELVKDTASAVEKYGKLFTMKSILEGKQTSRLKIELMKRRIYNS
jgi:DNA primase